jgi:hypothetical protein
MTADRRNVSIKNNSRAQVRPQYVHPISPSNKTINTAHGLDFKSQRRTKLTRYAAVTLASLHWDLAIRTPALGRFRQRHGQHALG